MHFPINAHLYRGGLLSRLLPLGLSVGSRLIGPFRWVSRVSLPLVTVTIHLQEQQLLSRTAPPPACTDKQKYRVHCRMSRRHTLTHIHTQRLTGHALHCARLHAGLQLDHPPRFDWIYDCGSPFPISTDWLAANLSHQTPTEDKAGCGRGPVLNWNTFLTAATMYCTLSVLSSMCNDPSTSCSQWLSSAALPTSLWVVHFHVFLSCFNVVHPHRVIHLTY